MERVADFWRELSSAEIIGGVVIVLVTMTMSYVVVCVVLVKLPQTYFRSDHEHNFFAGRHPVLRGVAIVLKNIVGVVLILAGIVLSLPAIPGPGLLTLFIGIMLTDFPGKRTLETKIIKRPSLLAAVNKLRARYGKPEFVFD
jgi:hypothetical protein